MTAAAVGSPLVRPPVPVVDIDLARPGEFRLPGDRGPTRPQRQARALVRLYGRPLGMVSAAGAAGPDGLWRALAETAHVELAEQLTRLRAVDRAETSGGGVRHPALQQAPAISVVVATRDRPGKLRHCLRSLLRSTYPAFEVIVVDNAPSDGATEALIREEFAGRVRYVREPVAGLARAHNRGLARVRGSVVAFTDDDTLVDPGWLPALAGTFARDPRIGCVTGLIVPAELETPAQNALERQGGFAKGYVPRTWSLSDPPGDPLFPFTAGRFGSGANMAFRTDALRALGGFDAATGAGTPGRGGDDLLAFFEILTAGHTLAYQPSAIIWHCHRRTGDAVAAQAFGYGAGLGAYLTGALLRHPRRLPALLRRLPRGIRYAMTRSHARGADPEAGWSRQLALLELRGMVYGPCGYLRGRLTGAGAGAR
ncbi:glycosyltransferase family 2 protein [Streptomyces sp. NPDC001914]|uniref:glycosyltransferase family 2 protein n=1 Tax=Streptomyces sp. NPDC001914 TaxID=3364623 RepID=UPI0036C3F458